MILNMFNKIILVFTICLFIFSNNSCQTFDDLQFDNLALRGQIEFRLKHLESKNQFLIIVQQQEECLTDVY
jgi:hypothetical protein